MKPLTIEQLINQQTEVNKNKIALINIENQGLTYNHLKQKINYVGSRLSELGITSQDRVATVLPNSVEMAIMFLGITKIAICCPLNPSYRASELEFYFADLQIRALVTLENRFSTAIEVAQKLNILVINLVQNHQKIGSFSLDAKNFRSNFDEQDDEAINPDRIALILHTSGTTSKPKQVPLTHRNLCTSAQNISKALQLEKKDVCLNLMPFFHVHGLVITLLSSLNVGSSIVCIPEFNLKQFWFWLEQFAPTWYSGVSTIHMAILQEARNNHQIIKNSTLRFIRTSSAPIPPEAILELESIFKIPVIQGYGMTEGSPQLTINPLPPKERKPESVGIPCGVKVAIIDNHGNFLPPMKIGEVVINNIYFDGYLGDPHINEQAFHQGWFRTGDLGYLDEEGYLFLKGRIKEIINRGGEKIMPLEVDMVAMKLPEIYQAVTFPVPHPTLGEDIAMAVVLEANQIITAQAIKEYLSKKLASFKVPHRVIMVEELPKGATKKLQRTALANQLANLLDHSEKISPRNHIEEQLVLIWEKILNVSPIGITDDFFDLGGNSILAVSMLFEVNKIFPVKDTSQLFLNLSTVEKFAQELKQLNQSLEQNKDQDLNLDSQQLNPRNTKETSNKIKIRLKNPLKLSNWLNFMNYKRKKEIYRLLANYQWNTLKIQRKKDLLIQCLEELGLTDKKEKILKRSRFSDLFSNHQWIHHELNKDKNFQTWVTFEGLEIVDELQAFNPGVIFVTAHCVIPGPSILIQKKFQFNNFVRITSEDNRQLAQTVKLTIDNTHKASMYFLYNALGTLQQGGAVYIAGDGHQGKNGLNLPFHGRQRTFYSGFADLSLMSQKPVLPVFHSFELNGLIKIKISQPIIPEGKTYKNKVLSMVKQYVELLEQQWSDDLANVDHRHIRKFMQLPHRK